MKVLHALIGYLAVTALPGQPFAFASPAFIHDGYVDSTQNNTFIDSALVKQVLGSIVDTCQNTYHNGYVNTTQIHSDSAISKRVPGDITGIEERQAVAPYAGFVPPAIAIYVLVTLVILSVLWIDSDDPRRSEFTQNTVSQASTQYPHVNWVICHSAYTTNFNGVEGTDWGMTHHEFKISFGRTIGYDLFWAGSGTFNRQGDGGYINWAYDGNEVSTDGGSVTFGLIY